MIQKNELRYGNKLLFLGELVTFESIGKIRKDGIFWIKTTEHGELEHKNFQFKPVLITPEVLVDFGFKEKNLSYYLGHIEIYYHRAYGCFLFKYGYKPNEKCSIEIKYAHQLQNLYFALNYEEIEFKPKKSVK